MDHESIDHETAIRDACLSGQLDVGAAAAFEAYGPEISSFLIARLRDASDAQEVFSMFAEDLWAGLPKFSWRCSMRTWAYTLARNAATRYVAAPQRRGGRNVALSDVSQLAVERARSATHLYQQTEVKDRFRSLRERLDADDQMLLVLRVDRGMAWRDLAITMAGNVDLDDEAIERESLRLRKAFERVKSELKRIAQREGLLKRSD
jgi:RNA polymerase sigma-70 factor (ECF subfamily)